MRNIVGMLLVMVSLTVLVPTQLAYAVNVNTETTIGENDIGVTPVTISVLSKTGVIKEVRENQILVVSSETTTETKTETETETNLRNSVVLNITEKTYLVDGKNGMLLTEKLKVDDLVTVYYSPVMTRSLPPQSNAFAVVKYDKVEMGTPKYVHVEEIVESNGSTKILVNNGSLWITLNEDVTVSPLVTKNIVTVNDIKVGSELLVWYDIVMMSYPGQTHTDKVVLLSSNLKEKESITISADTLSVNDTEIDLDTIFQSDKDLAKLSIYEKDGYVMLPLRKVAESLGYIVTWDSIYNCAKLENDSKIISIFSADSSLTVSVNPKNTDMVGMYRSTLDTTVDITNGVTFVPHTFFEKDLKLQVNIEK